MGIGIVMEGGEYFNGYDRGIWVWEGRRDDGYNGASLIGLEGIDDMYEYGKVGLNGERWWKDG